MNDTVAGQTNEVPIPDDPRIGSTLADRYRILAPLGEGGMGTVYRGIHEALRRPVAIKFLQQKIHGNREMVARFEREAVTAANLRHPNIADAIDYGTMPDGTLYLVMEYVEGLSLRQVIIPSQGLPVERVLRILEQMAAALDLAHSLGIVHRDLKPENVLVFDRGLERDVVKIIDFGIARINSATFETNPAALTQAGAIFGTPQYMAPEQVMGQPVDGRADQYAVGIIAFELLTGTQPFTGDNFAELVMKHVGAPAPLSSERVVNVPPFMDAAIARMMSKMPEERFATVTEAFRAMAGLGDAPPMSLPAATISRRSGTLIIPSATFATNPDITAAAAPNSTTQQVAFAATILPGDQRFLTRTLPSAVDRKSLQQPKKIQLIISGICGVLLLLCIIGIWKCSSSTNPAITEVITQWEAHKYSAAATALRAAIKADPDAVNDANLAKTLAASVRDPLALREIDSLLETTTLGQSATIAEKIADTAMTDEKIVRDPALDLLQGRYELLSAEQRARVAFRDADNCPALLDALTALDEQKTSATVDDADRYRRGECKKMIRRETLCSNCIGRSMDGNDDGPGSGPGPGPPGKGKTKKGK